jgi:hypothetical protein
MLDMFTTAEGSWERVRDESRLLAMGSWNWVTAHDRGRYEGLKSVYDISDANPVPCSNQCVTYDPTGEVASSEDESSSVVAWEDDETHVRMVLSKPPKPPSLMTDDERRKWAEEIARGLKPGS